MNPGALDLFAPTCLLFFAMVLKRYQNTALKKLSIFSFD